MATKPVPPSEVSKLLNLVIQSYNQQYNQAISVDSVKYHFIPARVSTRIGFEAYTALDTGFLKIRIYAQAFVLAPKFNPYRMEEVQDQPLGYGDEVYVSISDLGLRDFPILSQTLNPIIGDEAGPYAIELETQEGWIELEAGGYMETEGAQ